MTDLATTDLDVELERHRQALTGYCYRMLGSAFEAEDAVQETLVRAWRSHDRFEGRSTLRTWLYRIATNVCLDIVGSRQRRARPMDLGPAAIQPAGPGETLPEITWIQPIPDSRVLPDGGDPAETAVARESIRLAFVAALQHLPPRQRVVLILREVLHWKAEEVASLLDTTVASVNSALQRARATLADHHLDESAATAPMDDADLALLTRYVDAFERYDMDSLVALLHADATLSMPPYALWVRGRDEIERWMLGPGAGCRGSRALPTAANGSPACAVYRPTGTDEHRPFALQVLEVDDGRVTGLNAFLDTEALFPLFGMPDVLD
jgi:RNA polymerase sigma-70 factor (ECF subfamily)